MLHYVAQPDDRHPDEVGHGDPDQGEAQVVGAVARLSQGGLLDQHAGEEVDRHGDGHGKQLCRHPSSVGEEHLRVSPEHSPYLPKPRSALPVRAPDSGEDFVGVQMHHSRVSRMKASSREGSAILIEIKRKSCCTRKLGMSENA